MTSAKTIFTTRGCNGSLPGPPPKRDLRRHVPVYHTPFFWTRLPEILSLHTRPPGLARKLLPRASFRARGGGLSAWMERAGQPGRPAAARSCCLRREQLDPTWTEAGLACYRRLRRALNQQSRSTRMPRARPFACLRMGARTNSWPLRAKHERRARRAPGACRLGCGRPASCAAPYTVHATAVSKSADAARRAFLYHLRDSFTYPIPASAGGLRHTVSPAPPLRRYRPRRTT